MSVGIERLWVHLPAWYLPLEGPREADHEPGGPAERVTALAVAPPWEDTVTLGATAARRLLEAAGHDPGEIGLLVVATTSWSRTGALAPLVHGLLGIHSACRAVDVRHGAFAGTAAVLLAADWIRAARGRARRALVVAADMPARGPSVTVSAGAAGVALLVSGDPRALHLGEESGMWTRTASDPNGSADQVRTWLDGLAAAFLAFRPLEYPEPVGEEVVTDRLARLLLQPPCPTLAPRGHRRLLELDWQANERRWTRVRDRLEEAVTAAWAEQVAPTLGIVRQVGYAGAAALWLQLAALLEAEGRQLGGRRLGLFGWGHGDGGEFFTGLVPATVGQVADAGVGRALLSRRAVDRAQYVAACAAGAAGVEPDPAEAGGDFACVTAGPATVRYVRLR